MAGEIPSAVDRFTFGPQQGRELAAELGVGFVLEGSLRREGSTARVAARLVDARNETDVWADQFDGTMTSILGIQRQISEGIVRALKLRFEPSEGPGIPTRLPEHDWFLDNLRADPRFGELLERFRIEWEAFEL